MKYIHNIWETPEIQSINRLPMRSPLIPYESTSRAERETALGPIAYPSSSSSFYKCLDGEWDFAFFNSPLKAPNTKTKWNKIKVPLSWTMQGYSTPHYTNVQMPFDCVPPAVPEENPTGYYRLKTKIPAQWKNRRIVLHIGSAESVVILYINGKEAGVSKDTRLPCEFELNEFLTASQTSGKDSFEILIKVIRWSDASYVEDQDQWWFGGIHRSVYLYSTEKVFIADAKALTKVEWNDKSHTGIIPLEVTLGYSELTGSIIKSKQSETDRKKFKVAYKICKLEGTPFKGSAGKTIEKGTIDCSLDVRNTLCNAAKEIRIRNPKLWSNETPELYLITVSLYDGKRHVESASFTCGFKSVEIKDRKLLLNNKKVYIHGVNRHEHNEYTAKTLTTEEMVHDIMLLKNFNFNAVRTCHYPDDERWYDLCDRFGIWILDEANIENHAYYDVLSRSEQWLNAYIQRTQRMVRRDKNHACIFAWSLGNESGNGPNLIATGNWIRGYDTTRLVHYEGFVRPEIHQGDFTLESLGFGKHQTDFIGPMYPKIELIKEYAKTRDDYRPIIMCEYSHAMGNANGSLADYWKAIESTPGLQGGFIWDWVDQGIAATTKDGKKYWKYGGDFGDSPCDFDFCLNGILFPDKTPKPAMYECKRLFAPVRLEAVNIKKGVFSIENKFDFSKLNLLSFEWNLSLNGRLAASGKQKLEPLAPGEKQLIAIPLAALFKGITKKNDDLQFNGIFRWNKDTSFAKKGDIVSIDQIEIQKGTGFADFADFVSSCVDSASVIASIKGNIVHAYTENECVKNKISTINDVPTPWDFANKPTKEWINSDLMGKQGKFVKTSITKKDCGTYADIKIDLELSKKISEYPRAGITMEIPKEYEEIIWYGKGPHENYSDRNFSAIKGFHREEIKNMKVPYIVPQENGLRTGTNYIELNAAGKTLHIQSEEAFSFSILPYTAQELFRCNHTHELKESSKWILSIDAVHRGVGTGACGPDTRDEYKIKPGRYNLHLRVW
ncbi:MAG: glycoside hydrolase family 2 TIM barrel-domain containing protein [Spirochaetales bacterium]|nr:glycoside hydrolase family 2 TIM barrel-domain containing protein [Spirochaetales bacterium]